MSPEMRTFVMATLSAGRALQTWVSSVITDDWSARDLGDEFRRQTDIVYRAHAALQQKRKGEKHVEQR